MISSMHRFLDKRRLTGFLAVCVVFVAVFWLGNRPTLYIVEQQKLSGAPDFFLEGVQSRSFDETGKLEQTLTAVSAYHYTGNRNTLLNSPIIKSQNANILSVASGKTGTISDATNSFSLQGDASIVRFQNNSEVVRVQANTLVYNDAMQTIQGQHGSKLITAKGTTQSDSIIFDLAQDIATLTGGVTSHYEVSQH